KAPDRLSGTGRTARLGHVPIGAVKWEDDLIHRRVIAAGPTEAVVEDQGVPRARPARRNPVGVMRGEEPLIGLCPGTIGPGISPAIEKIATLSALASGVARSLSSCGAMIDDPKLAECADGQHDLVEVGVIGDGVDVGPIRSYPRSGTRRRRSKVPDAPENA